MILSNQRTYLKYDYVLTDVVGGVEEKMFYTRSRRTDQAQQGPCVIMYLLTEWEGLRRKCFIRGHDVRIKRSKARAS